MNVDGASERVTQLIDEEFARKVTEINEEETSVRTRELIDKITRNVSQNPSMTRFRRPSPRRSAC